jgi:hypothetical protein
MAFGVFVTQKLGEPPWDDMQKAIDSFPVPEGYQITERVREGGGCALNPGCQKPTLSIWIDSLPGKPVVSCATVQASIDQWSKADFVPGARRSDVACEFAGTMLGHPVDVRFFVPGLAGTQTPRDSMTVVVSK